MNIHFFGYTSLAAQDLVIVLKEKFKLNYFSRKKTNKSSINYFDLKKPNNKTFDKINKLKSEYIFFFSSYVPMAENKSKWKDCEKTNVYGVIRFLENLRYKPKKIILTSSCSVYGNENCEYNEETLLKPSTGYSLSKFAQENIFRIFCKKNRIKFLCYRLGYVYGKNMNKKRLIVKIWSKIKRKKKISIYNKNINLNLIHTKDIANIISSTFVKVEGIFNLTNFRSTSLLSFYIMLLKKKNIKNRKNNFQSKKIFKIYPKNKILKLAKAIEEFKSAN